MSIWITFILIRTVDYNLNLKNPQIKKLCGLVTEGGYWKKSKEGNQNRGLEDQG